MSVAFDSDVDITVEVAFDNNPFDSSLSFTDISTYVRQFNTKRGRANELGQFVGGTASLLLSNADNRFNPNNTSSPYFDSANAITKIQPLKPVRIKANYDSQTYPIFFGFLDMIPVSFPALGADSVVQFNCVDAFKILNSQTLSSAGWRLGRGGFSEIGESTVLGYEDIQELSSARVTRLLDQVQFPSALRDIQTGTIQVISQSSSTSDILTNIRQCETAENAQFFVGKDGKAVFRNRDYRLANTKATTVQAIFSNDGSNLPYSDIVTSFDTHEVRNVYQWTRTGGATQFVSDANSVQRYRPIASVQSTINVSDSDVLSIIEQKIAETSLPIVRIDSLKVNPRQNTSIWEKALGLEFGDRISVKIVNPDSSSYTDELWIESISHTVNASTQTWDWTVTLSPAGSSGWVLGQAQLGVGTRFAYT
tara:strand:+ start:1954 stop:3222 length:1269 start_codon:yes stop_codon:yes gene_type:complete